MSSFNKSILALALVTASFGSWAQTDAQHTQHHPAEATAGMAMKGPAATPANSADQMSAMDARMKAMQEMHERMMAAQTSEERNALMAEHMKTMQAGMAAMNMMGSVDKPGMQGKKPMPHTMKQRQQMMEKRMEMMEAMMQLMMDRMPPSNP
jgi:hypothetical protein